MAAIHNALGHTIARHVGLSPEQMIARLNSPRAPGRVSSFNSVKQTELLISDMLSLKRSQLEGALKYRVPEAKLPLEHWFSFPVGTYIDKGTTTLRKAYTVRVIIRSRQFGGKTYYILTAYPAP